MRTICFFIIVFSGCVNRSFAQMSITGSTCVLSGTQYSYIIAGNWSGSTSMSWTVSGGIISGPASGTPLPQIHVTWNPGISSGTVSVSTSSPTSRPSLTVTLSPLLSGGSLSNTSQNIIANTIPATINSSASASGGYCTPTYAYQWQQSIDNVSFNNITGAGITKPKFLCRSNSNYVLPQDGDRNILIDNSLFKYSDSFFVPTSGRR